MSGISDDPRQGDEVRDVERHHARRRLVQVLVDALGERPADARDLGDVVDRRGLHAAQSAEVLRAAPGGAWRRCPGISFSIDVVRALARRARWPTMAKRCASSRIAWMRCRPGCEGGELQRCATRTR